MELSKLGLERVVHLKSRLRDSLLAGEGKKKWILHVCDFKICFTRLLKILEQFLLGPFTVGNVCFWVLALC